MLEEFPQYNFLAEALESTVGTFCKKVEGNEQLTSVIFLRSLFEFVLITFTATACPLESPFHTFANPPWYSGSLALS